ncbi:MAG: GntR family transcriptional regulator [Desulfobacterales bacterium]|nr:GntR family transcriptional regulator [Desulfobacterales bacterium]
MKSNQIEKLTLSQKVYKSLKERIIIGELLPGQSITHKLLANDFGVSIIPIREALSQLESEGIVVRRSNKDLKIRKLTIDEFEEIADIRLILEPYILKLACEKRSAADIVNLSAIYDKFNSINDDHIEYLKVNQEFHFAIYKVSKHDIVLGLIESLWAYIGPYISLNTYGKDRSVTMGFHNKMFDAFVDQDCDKLIEATKMDIKTSSIDTISIIKSDSFSLK